jgi:hypothetical protein
VLSGFVVPYHKSAKTAESVINETINRGAEKPISIMRLPHKGETPEQCKAKVREIEENILLILE